MPSVVNDIDSIEDNTMNDDSSITVERSLDKRVTNFNGGQCKNVAKNQPSSKNILNFSDNLNKSPKNSQFLEYSLWSRGRCAKAVGTSAMFTIIALTVGVLIISFTSPKATLQKWKLNFIAMSPTPIDYNYGPRSVAVGDFNNDTCLDMTVANHIVNIIAIYLGHMDMDATFSNEKEYTTGTGSTQYMVAIGDFNNDDLLNIAVANSGTNNVGIFLGFGNGSFKTQIELSTGSARSIAISLADFNKDTSLDIATVDYGTHSISIFYGYGTDYFSTP
ncbi:unnamed protein product, partial [Rotaria magnacalcarata]